MMADPSTPSNLMTFCWLARPLNRTSFQVPVPAFCEPGACSISCDIWRPLTGRLCDLALADVDADARRADVDRADVRRHGDRLGHARGLQRQIEREFLAGDQLQAGEFQRRKLPNVALIV